MLVTFLLPQVCLVAGEDTVLICQSNRTEQGDTKVYFATWAERTCLVVKYLKYLDPGCIDDCSTATHECEPVCWVKCSSSPEKVCFCFSSIQEKQINWQQMWKSIVWVKCSGSAEKDRSDLYFSLAFKLNFPLHLDVSWSKTESLLEKHTETASSDRVGLWRRQGGVGIKKIKHWHKIWNVGAGRGELQTFKCIGRKNLDGSTFYFDCLRSLDWKK